MNFHELIRPSKRAWRKLRERQDFDAVRRGYDELGMQERAEDVDFYRSIPPVLAALELGKKAKVLDAACGVGPLCRALREAGFEDVEAFDISDENLKAAAPLVKRVFQSSAEKVAAPDARYDVVAAVNMIEHLMNPEAALLELKRILKPGGWLYITTDNSWWQTMMVLRRLVTPPSTWYRRYVQPIDGDFTTWEMRALLERAGFEENRLTGIGGVPVADRYVSKLIGRPTTEHPWLKHFTTRMAFLSRRPLG